MVDNELIVALSKILDGSKAAGATKLFEDIGRALGTATNDELTRAASRAELENRLLQVQARTAIELALATRIQTATHVEIEEHYAVSGDAGVGVGIEAQHVGVHGHGRTVTQRTIRLEGWRVPDDISRAAKGAHDEPSTDAPARSRNGRPPL